MENQKHCADLFRRRSFTDKFSDTADFVGACWKPLLRILSAVLVPLCLLQTFFGSAAALGATAGKAEILGFSSGLLCSSLLQFIGSVLVIITVYGMMQVYPGCLPFLPIRSTDLTSAPAWHGPFTTVSARGVASWL